MNSGINYFDMYDAYCDNINIRSDRARTRIVQYEDQLDYIYNIISPYKKHFLLLDINIDTIKTTDSLNTSTISEKKLAKAELRTVTIDENLLKNYLVSFGKCRNKIIRLKNYIAKIESTRMPKDIYGTMLKTFNFELSKKLLTGYVFNLGFNLGKLYIKKIRRVFSINGKEATKKVDWGASKKRRAELIKEGITPYDKDKTPHGEKWFVYHTDDYLYWFWWEKWTSRVPNAFLYTFTPTSYINTDKRSQIQFTKECKTKDEILDTNLLGNKDKLYCLIRFDPNHSNTYITDERQEISK